MQPKNHTRVVITGIGAVTPLGNNAVDFWRGIQAGQNGIRPITAYDTADMACKLAAECDFDPADHGISPAKARKMDRFAQLGLAAALEAVRDSGVTAENTDLTRAGVLVSSGVGGLQTSVREHDRALEKGFDRVSPFYIPMIIPNMAAGNIAIEIGFRGDCTCLVTACAGGTHAIGEAMRQIRHGYADVMLCGGTEACITPMGIGGFTSMKAVCLGDDPARASIPFDAERSGFVMGEGAGMLILESLDHAQKRGATIIAEVTGFAGTCDAYHITAPEPTGEGGGRAMANALADAGISPADVGYINAHGTSTPLNDKGETVAVKAVFGADTKIPMSSTKSMTGHLLGAAGAVEAIVCALACRDGFIPPTIGYAVPDPDCDLDIVPNAGRKTVVHYAMSNSLGFGGHNASLVIKR